MTTEPKLWWGKWKLFIGLLLTYNVGIMVMQSVQFLDEWNVFAECHVVVHLIEKKNHYRTQPYILYETWTLHNVISITLDISGT